MDGTATEFPPITGITGTPAGIVTGPDGNVWFTEYSDQLVEGAYPAWVVRLQP